MLAAYKDRHPCEMDKCDRYVQFDDEPYCFTHSPDAGSYVRGYSYKKQHPKKEISMYVVRWTFTDGDVFIDTDEPVIKYDTEVIVFLEEALDFIRGCKSEPNTVAVTLYECHEIEIPL